MSKIIASSAIEGAHKIYKQAVDIINRTIEEKGADHPVGFPDTTYYLPVIYSILGNKVEKLSDMLPILEECKGMLPDIPSESTWLPYLGGTLDSGIATLFCFEMIEACKYLIGPNPVDGIWLGAASDVIIRERGIEFVDGSAPGFAAVVGAAPDNETAVKIARELQEKNLYVFIAGNTNGVSFAEQLVDAGVEVGWETRLVPFGKDISAAIYALGFANRAALSFGGVEPGDYQRNLKYNKNRIFAFVIALGEVDEEKYAAAAGAINYGFPTIADTDIPQILPSGICTYEHVVSNVPLDKIVEKALEVRGCKIKIAKVPIPVSYGPAFEGERIRKEQTFVEFGGNRTPAFEYVTTKDLSEVEDNKITVIGPDIKDIEEGTALPLGIWVEVAGRKMQPDFESILERQIHHLINGAEGVWHMGQRDIIWVRISKAAKEKGFTIAHFGEILHAKLLNDYPAIVDKIQVTIFTDKDEVEKKMEIARAVYKERNARVEQLTDDSVDTFYSCLLCQSFAPNHVCVITPERLGLCGAYNWLDGKAAYEIDPTGPNQPLPKGECLDPIRGQWREINDYVYVNSKQTISSFNAYSILEDPMTSCGCFEAIVSLLPECNGVAIVNREYSGDTPMGMKFSTLAGITGGGQQTPGFIGIGKAYISSRKFISAEGGHQRIVWMPKELKETLKDELAKIGEQIGIPNFVDIIADESIGTDTDSIRAYMEKVDHPALKLWDITQPSPELAEFDAQKGAKAASSAVSGQEVQKPTINQQKSEVKELKKEKSVEQTHEQDDAQQSLQPAQSQAIHSVSSAPAGQVGSIAYVVEVLNQLKNLNIPVVDSNVPASEQWAALQMSTALNLLTAGANMLLMSQLAPMQAPIDTEQSVLLTQKEDKPADEKFTLESNIADACPIKPVMNPIVVDTAVQKPISPAKVELPSTFELPLEKAAISIKKVTLGGSGTRTSEVIIGGANVMPFHHFEGDTGYKQTVAVEILDSISSKYPDSLKEAYGNLVEDPVEWAKHCVEILNADMISLRLDGTHPDNENKSADEACALIDKVLKAVGVPLIITGCSHFEKNNEVMKAVASAFSGENLLLNWAETDNYKTIVAAAMGYNHCVVAQTPIDVNMAKQLNILMTNMGLAADKIVIDALTGAIGYGLEYTYSVMERIRTSAFTGDDMLAMPMLGTPGYEVAKTKEAKAPISQFPLWGPESERSALLEISTAMALLLSGADLLIMYHPTAVKTLQRKIEEMNNKNL